MWTLFETLYVSTLPCSSEILLDNIQKKRKDIIKYHIDAYTQDPKSILQNITKTGLFFFPFIGLTQNEHEVVKEEKKRKITCIIQNIKNKVPRKI